MCEIGLNAILPAFVGVCILGLREEHGWRVFENRVLTEIFGPKRTEVTGDWRQFHNQELHDVYPVPDDIW
jgi:hypothetical protein